MKKLFAVGLVLFLVSCLQVDNFGDYWEKTTLDPRLEGKWVRVNESDTDNADDHIWTFVVKDGAYEVHSEISGEEDDEPMYPVKTLKAGRYTYLAQGPDQGSILRYKVEGPYVTFFVLNPERAWPWIRKHFPEQMNMYRGDTSAPEYQAPDDVYMGQIKISTLSDDVYKILSSIPDNDAYWDPDTQIEKME